MNIYSMTHKTINDEPEFMTACFANSAFAQSSQGMQARREGAPLDCEWIIGPRPQQIASFSLFTSYGLFSPNDVIQKIKNFAPNNIVNPVLFKGVSSDFSFMQPANFIKPAAIMPHVFLLFDQFKTLLVTQAFVNAWNENNFTGADFQFTTQIDTVFFLSP